MSMTMFENEKAALSPTEKVPAECLLPDMQFCSITLRDAYFRAAKIKRFIQVAPHNDETVMCTSKYTLTQ